ncbi:MAG: hypothetical protein KJ060_21155, partial [Candidatus Hydrogenedentes bacterium]|nr:hypothetical protein [Candidatus Hydrogenedentota bacterium]
MKTKMIRVARCIYARYALMFLVPVLSVMLVLTGCSVKESDSVQAETPSPAASSGNGADNASKPDEPRDANRLWCNEHGVYEDECVIC